MKFKEAQCPTCGGILQVPEDLEKLTCMYCGKELESTELIYKNYIKKVVNDTEDSALLDCYNSDKTKAILKAKDLLEADRFHYTANYILGIHEFPKLLTKHRELAAAFKKNTYEEVMDPYIIESKEVVEYIDRACRVRADQRTEILTTYVNQMIADMKEIIPQVAAENETKESFILDDFKMVVALYLIPMILELHLDISEDLTDIIIKEWIRNYPKMPIRKGLYENIRNGFRKKGFCYITTAVCETLHKDDNCYELMMFRSFRDNYLYQQEDGKSLVEEYYKVAPTIVQRINQLEDRDRIYSSIWEKHLKDCLLAIEAGNDSQCMDMYCQMVKTLEKEYILQ